MKILGIHDGHNAAAALLVDGKIAAAIQEERLRRVKNWAGFPETAIRKVLKMGSFVPADLDYVAMNGHHMPYPKKPQEVMEEYAATGSLRTSIKRFLKKTIVKTLYHEKRRAERSRAVVQMGIPEEKIVYIDHHLAHAAGAYYGSNFADREVLVLTADGAGDGLCATVNIGRAGHLERIASIPESESIGNIYAMITFLLGMVPLEHEHKLMGLAPYAPEAGACEVHEKLRPLIRFPENSPFIWERADACPETYYSYDFFKDLTHLKRFDWICAGLQRFTEEILVTWIRRCITETGIRTVALGGGLFMNVKANKCIMEMPEIERLFVFPSCGDESNCIGAAMQLFVQVQAERGTPALPQALGPLYLGTDFEPADVEEALSGSRELIIECVEDIEIRLAELLADGQVVARMCGRSEFGVRALGNRSILADPTNPGLVRTINDMIKNRDFWMPFAPSVLAESASNYLIGANRYRSAYMMMCFDTTKLGRRLRAAIHPYDFTIRPQVVFKNWNHRYYRLISEFEKLSGVGAVLNTSFNLHGLPIVESPADALDVLKRSGLRYLAIGDLLVSKKPP